MSTGQASLSHFLEEMTSLFGSPMAQDIFTKDVLDENNTTDSGANIVAPCSSPVCSNVPNSSLDHHTDSATQLTAVSDFHYPQTHSPAATSPPIIDNLLVVLGNQPHENTTDDTYTAIDRYFSTCGNIYRFGPDWTIQLYEQLNSSPYTETPLGPVKLGQNFRIGLVYFYLHDDGRLYSIVDRPDHIEPKPVFNTADEVQFDLYLAQGLPSPPLSIDSDTSGVQDHRGNRESPSVDWDALTFSSPASSDSATSEASIGSSLSLVSLFSEIGSDDWSAVAQSASTGSPASPHESPRMTPPPSPPAPFDEMIPVPHEKTATKADVDRYADQIKSRRLKLKGSKSAQIQVECPWCGWTSKRPSHPSELKEHMYAHRGLSEFPCPSKGCKHVSNRKSNLTRHVSKHHPALATELKAKRLKRF